MVKPIDPRMVQVLESNALGMSEDLEKAIQINRELKNSLESVRPTDVLNQMNSEIPKVARETTLRQGAPDGVPVEPREQMQSVIQQLDTIFKALHQKNQQCRAVLAQAKQGKDITAVVDPEAGLESKTRMGLGKSSGSGG